MPSNIKRNLEQTIFQNRFKPFKKTSHLSCRQEDEPPIMSSRRRTTYHVVKKTSHLSCHQEDEPTIMSWRRANYHVVKKTSHPSCRQEDEPPIMSSRRRATYHIMKTSQLSCRQEDESPIMSSNNLCHKFVTSYVKWTISIIPELPSTYNGFWLDDLIFLDGFLMDNTSHKYWGGHSTVRFI